MSSPYIVILTTFSKAETGDRLTKELLERKLAACIQALPIKSSYTWKGEICHDNETLLLIKTKGILYKEIERTILDIHDYETPEIVALPIEQGSATYTTWIKDVTL